MEKITKIMEEGKVEWLYDNGYIEKPKRLDWKDRATKIRVIKNLLNYLEKNLWR